MVGIDINAKKTGSSCENSVFGLRPQECIHTPGVETKYTFKLMSSPSTGDSRVSFNNTCYTGDASSTLQAFGDAAKMGASMSGAFITLVCCLIFVYFGAVYKNGFAWFIGVCCCLSLGTSIWQYVAAQNDIKSLQDAGKIHKC